MAGRCGKALPESLSAEVEGFGESGSFDSASAKSADASLKMTALNLFSSA